MRTLVPISMTVPGLVPAFQFILKGKMAEVVVYYHNTVNVMVSTSRSMLKKSADWEGKENEGRMEFRGRVSITFRFQIISGNE